MIRIDFAEPKTALEIRDPLVIAFEGVALSNGCFVAFKQPQQIAFDGFPGQKKRTRIGNGNHKQWRFDFQTDPPNIDDPDVIGSVMLRSLMEPSSRLYGGFDYGKYPDPKPIYEFVDLLVPSEADDFSFYSDPEEKLVVEAFAAAQSALSNS